MAIIAFAVGLIIGGILGYHMGADKRQLLEIEVKHLRTSRDSAASDAQFWRQLYEKQAGIDPGPERPETD